MVRMCLRPSLILHTRRRGGGGGGGGEKEGMQSAKTFITVVPSYASNSLKTGIHGETSCYSLDSCEEVVRFEGKCAW